ncbi:unnamed protein product [Dracunculus medinensis]|uniref:Membrane magnesium transporter n=1 Tax=Dracunculus medinensis TaxID=318479 RepID=A0A0N4UJY0_DRAME|nr:unnamed protein product [Dracunculus medinensis]
MNSSFSSFVRVLCIVGLVSLLHCAYSAAQICELQLRFYLRITEQPFTHLPADLIVQTLISLIIIIYGASYITGDFQPIRSDIQNRTKSWDTMGSCPSFYIFHHRAKAVSPGFNIIRQQYCEVNYFLFKIISF